MSTEEDEKKQPLSTTDTRTDSRGRGERKSEEDWVMLDDRSVTVAETTGESDKVSHPSRCRRTRGRTTMAAGVDLTFSFEESSPLRELDELHFVCATKLGEDELDVYSEDRRECGLKYCVGLRMDIDHSHTVETLLSSEWMNSLRRFQTGASGRRSSKRKRRMKSDSESTPSSLERAVIVVDGFKLTSPLWDDPMGSAQAVLQGALELSQALRGRNLRESFAVFPFVWPSEGAMLFGEGTDEGYNTALNIQVLSHSLKELIQRLECYFDSVDIVAVGTGCNLAMTALGELQRLLADGSSSRGSGSDETEVYGGGLDSPKSDESKAKGKGDGSMRSDVSSSSAAASSASAAAAIVSAVSSSKSTVSKTEATGRSAKAVGRSVVRKLVLIAAEMPRSQLKEALVRIDRHIEVTAYVNTWDVRLAALTWLRWSEDRAGHSLEIISDNGRRMTVVDVTDIVFDWQRTGHYYASHPLVLSDLRNCILEDKPPDLRWDLTKQRYVVPASDRSYDYYVLTGSEQYSA